MKKKISNEYIFLMKYLDDDKRFISMFYTVPFTLLEFYVPKDYLIRRTDYLKKKGKLK